MPIPRITVPRQPQINSIFEELVIDHDFYEQNFSFHFRSELKVFRFGQNLTQGSPSQYQLQQSFSFSLSFVFNLKSMESGNCDVFARSGNHVFARVCYVSSFRFKLPSVVAFNSFAILKSKTRLSAKK